MEARKRVMGNRDIERRNIDRDSISRGVMYAFAIAVVKERDMHSKAPT